MKIMTTINPVPTMTTDPTTRPVFVNEATRPVFSIIVPIWNEEQVIPELYKRVVTIMDSTGQHWELVCVNEGSRER